MTMYERTYAPTSTRGRMVRWECDSCRFFCETDEEATAHSTKACGPPEDDQDLRQTVEAGLADYRQLVREELAGQIREVADRLIAKLDEKIEREDALGRQKDWNQMLQWMGERSALEGTKAAVEGLVDPDMI